MGIITYSPKVLVDKVDTESRCNDKKEQMKMMTSFCFSMPVVVWSL